MRHQEPIQENRSRRRTLVLLALTLFLSMSTWFSASAVIPQLRSLWQLSPGSAAWLTIAVQLGFVGGALLSAILNLPDVLSPRRVILWGSLGAATVNILLLAAGSFSVGIPMRFATGFFLAGVYPPAFKLISTWYQKGRGLALGILAAALVMGNGVPHLANGLGGLDWRFTIAITSALTVAGGLIAWFAVSEGPYPFPAAKFNPRQAGRVFANRCVRLASFGYIGHMWELFAMYAWFSVFFAASLQAWGTSPGAIPSFATFAMFVASGLGCWAGGILANRWGKIRTTIVMLSVSGSCSVLIGLLFGFSPWLLMAVGLVWAFTVVADSAQFSALVTELADQSYVGTALTLQLASGFTITVVTIWLLPLIQTLVGWRWAFAFLLPGPIFAILAMLRLKSSLESHQPETACVDQAKRQFIPATQ